MKTLEEMQYVADAIETLEFYQKRFWFRSLVLLSKTIGWVTVGFLIECGFQIARLVWK